VQYLVIKYFQNETSIHPSYLQQCRNYRLTGRAADTRNLLAYSNATPVFRSFGVSAKLVEQVKQYGQKQEWSCIELCTPPLPEFERTLSFRYFS
jgi:hypothetical protein